MYSSTPAHAYGLRRYLCSAEPVRPFLASPTWYLHLHHLRNKSWSEPSSRCSVDTDPGTTSLLHNYRHRRRDQSVFAGLELGRHGASISASVYSVFCNSIQGHPLRCCGSNIYMTGRSSIGSSCRDGDFLAIRRHQLSFPDCTALGRSKILPSNIASIATVGSRN